MGSTQFRRRRRRPRTDRSHHHNFKVKTFLGRNRFNELYRRIAEYSVTSAAVICGKKTWTLSLTTWRLFLVVWSYRKWYSREMMGNLGNGVKILSFIFESIHRQLSCILPIIICTFGETYLIQTTYKDERTWHLKKDPGIAVCFIAKSADRMDANLVPCEKSTDRPHIFRETTRPRTLFRSKHNKWSIHDMLESDRWKLKKYLRIQNPIRSSLHSKRFLSVVLVIVTCEFRCRVQKGTSMEHSLT